MKHRYAVVVSAATHQEVSSAYAQLELNSILHRMYVRTSMNVMN